MRKAKWQGRDVAVKLFSGVDRRGGISEEVRGKRGQEVRGKEGAGGEREEGGTCRGV